MHVNFFKVLFCFILIGSWKPSFVLAKVETIEKKFDVVWPGGLLRSLKVYSLKNDTNSKKSVLIYFHSTDFPVYLDRPAASPFGLAYESELIEKLVTKHQFIVVAPDAALNYGSLAWQTNLTPFFFDFEKSPDYQFIDYVFKNLDQYYPRLDAARVFVGGLSSGGYMASRLAILPEFSGKIRGVFVHSASYASCISYYCYIPEEIPKFHPATLLIASRFDPLVPEGTVEVYYDKLKLAQIPSRLVSHHGTWHGMYDSDVKLIIDWLTAF